ncbi:MAG: type IV pilin protein [Candidatus Omnitrophica bacterium]|nr:type IV pilin protein [Candidatus Omnitrophota bacterium]MDD5552991.1 type IV pilin protein [Candidatus Omnitrophota bacterium]
MRKSPAFTFIELIVVVVVIGLLVLVAIANYAQAPESARAAEAYSMLAEISASENRYYMENSAYTTTLTDLDIFESAPSSSNFTFSVPSADASSGYAQAARSCPGAGCGTRKSYGMCFQSSKRASCGADICNPSCP